MFGTLPYSVAYSLLLRLGFDASFVFGYVNVIDLTHKIATFTCTMNGL